MADYFKEGEKLEERAKNILQSTYRRFEANRPVNMIPPDSGLYGAYTQDVEVQLKPAASQQRVGINNAEIIFGPDRPSGLQESKYIRKGALRAKSIDLVVGRMSSINNGKGPAYNRSGDSPEVDNHFGADAARIVISHLTDIDTNFQLADGKTGNIKGRAGIGIKADVVRIIGREGIKIVTGKAPFKGMGLKGETNSRGTRLVPAPPIELIAGNNTRPNFVLGGPLGLIDVVSTLQPLVKGENTTYALKELGNIVDEIWSAVFNLGLVSAAFNSTLGAEPLLVITKGTAPQAANQVLDSVINSLWHTRFNKSIWEIQYLEEFGHRYICSRNVTTT
jgi:hypothetical protein